METCPICLDFIHDDDNFLKMPQCFHKIHTLCALKAVKYDARCPICRTKDPELTHSEAQEEHAQVYTHLERLAEEHDSMLKRYKRRRAREIKKNSRLTRLRDRLNEEKKCFVQKEKELEREWLLLQKNNWKHDKLINSLKNERKKHQRRTNSLCKRLENEIETILGPKPDDFLFIN